MNFDLTEDQLMIKQMVKDFSEKEIKPYLNQWDQDEEFPIETMKFICNGTALNNTDIIPLDVSLIALAIIPIECHDH